MSVRGPAGVGPAARPKCHRLRSVPISEPPLEFPTDRPHLNDLTDWISAALPGAVQGPVRVLQVKRWGVAATYRVGERLVVVKDAHPPLFPYAAEVHRAVERTCPAATAPLLADETTDSWQRTIFEFMPGDNADELDPKPLDRVAEKLAEVQVALVDSDLSGLPSYDVEGIVHELLADLSATGDQPAETVDWLVGQLPRLQEWSTELAGRCPQSLDHPDVNPSNALVARELILLDWEEAVVGCPMMSLYRLLADAEEAGCVDAVKAAYLRPWQDLTGAARVLDLALRLAPLKLTVEMRAYARGLGWDHPHQRQTARLLSAARDGIDG